MPAPSLPTIHLKSPLTIKPEPLTPAAFSPFGTAIATPLKSSQTSFPFDGISPSVHPNHQPQPVAANQNTALKTSPISPLINNYPVSGSSNDVQANTEEATGRNGSHKPTATGLMSIFSSFPRQNIYLAAKTETSAQGQTTTSALSTKDTAQSAIIEQQKQDEDTSKHTLKLKVGILERHPYTTQTFCPFNYSSSTSSKVEGETPNISQTYMLVIVAPTLPTTTTDTDTSSSEISSSSQTPAIPNPPDLSRLRAFLHPLQNNKNLDHRGNSNGLPTSAMAVTYNPGTWHAPMIVLGPRRVDFLVTQFANGVGNDDCQEVLVGSGPDEAVLSGSVREKRRRVTSVGFSRQDREGDSEGDDAGELMVEVDLGILLVDEQRQRTEKGRGRRRRRGSKL